jgi:ferredoxin
MEVDVKFEPSGRNGVVPVGTYLIDAARRFGIRLEDEYDENGKFTPCAVKITKGGNLLSEPTQVELEHLSEERRKKGERLASQAKIEKSGEICVMTTEKVKPEPTPFESFQKEFGKLPLDEKVKYLLQLETVTLGETFAYLLNLPYTIGEKIRDGMAEFGFKMEEAEKQAKRPAEHQKEVKEEKTEEPKTKKTAAKSKTSAPRKPTARKRTTKTEEKQKE